MTNGRYNRLPPWITNLVTSTGEFIMGTSPNITLPPPSLTPAESATAASIIDAVGSRNQPNLPSVSLPPPSLTPEESVIVTSIIDPVCPQIQSNIIGCRYPRLSPPTCIAAVVPATEFAPDPSHSVPNDPLPLVSLTLKECAITSSIIDVHSRVTLSQRFQNQSDLEAGQVMYSFNMIASAAVCDFEVVRQDGTKVVSVVKEKEQAHAELETALAAGQITKPRKEQTKDGESLSSYHRDCGVKLTDNSNLLHVVFSICIGNVLPRETITINLSYINALIDDGSPNQVRFTLPRAYMQRYGVAPESRISGSVGHEDIPFTMEVSIQQAGRIRSLTCPSGFNLTVNLGRPDRPGASVGPDVNFAVVNVRRNNTSVPSQDVILAISADGLGSPRAIVECHPKHQTAAIGLTFVPQFKSIESPLGMEYIFLVDRSSSMRGANMYMARKAHTALLQGLPSRNTTFNLFSFGSKVSSLWPVSRIYDQDSVDTAMSHIEAMQADYGGTEIAHALEAVYKSLTAPLTRPVSIFLLTDGDVRGVQSCDTITQNAIRSYATNTTFMRVFTVGLGQGVSTATCDRIAHASGGVAIYIATTGEEYLGKCAQIVCAARTAPVSDINVSWPGALQACDDGGERQPSGAPVKLFEPKTDNGDELSPHTVPVQSAPSIIPSFFPSTRFQIFAIVPHVVGAANNTSALELEKHEIKITGFVRATNVPVEVVVPVQNVLHPPEARTAFIHTAAAKALIIKLDDQDLNAFGMPQNRSAIVRLATTYRLSSRFTNFIAVDGTQRLPIGMSNSSHVTDQASPKITVPTNTTYQAVRQQIYSVLSSYLRRLSVISELGIFPGKCRRRSLLPTSDCPEVVAAEVLYTVVVPSPPLKVQQARVSPGRIWGPPIRRLTERHLVSSALPLPLSSIPGSSAGLGIEYVDEEEEELEKEVILVALAHLQRLDGSFASNSATVIALLTKLVIDETKVRSVFEKHAPVSSDPEVAAVLLAWAWMSFCCGTETEGMKEKADLWLREYTDLHLESERLDIGAIQRELLDAVVFRPLSW
ncbi:hypothetical protein BJ138DRAFT_1202531 [Hygrophoropsis aurantiaca]|uniref:Uncharacterized protein n=1 Tax=Hygrophoropsis aurantiaca TaxID=72124 RepID=A0ACB8A770_9AGAM|nr:hypothetical protein BJ138DRAFT_1202531 [Hygrophoropsis aurantiaca]